MEGSLMREEWKSVSMKHGAQFVTTFIHGDGILHKQMLFVNSWDTPGLVNYFFHACLACSVMHSIPILQRHLRLVLEEAVYLYS